MEIKVPHNAQRVLNMLEQAGHPSYVVGGCVRDALMGRIPNDWDICTAARPQQVKELCAREGLASFDTGIQHGTVTVHVDHEPFEVTTFRADGAYEDGRHPVSVSFLDAVEGDLARRDFTVNAMAYSPARGLVDVFGGRDDLARKTLRCVGDPAARFAEDGLRILRALRFASTLGFAIDPATAAALHEHRRLLEPVAMERISAEFMKLICGQGAVGILLEYRDVVGTFLPQVEPMFGFEQLSRYHVYDVWEHCVRSCGLIEPDPVLRLAALVHDVGKPSCFFTDDEGIGHFYGHPEAGEPLARQIARHAAAERGDRVLPRQLLRAERVEQLEVGARALGALSVREYKAADRQPGSLQTAADRAAIQRPDRIVRDEHHLFRVRHGADLLAGPLQKAAPDPDLIASRCVDRYRFHRPSTSSLRFLPSSSSCVSASPSFSAMAARYCMRQSISPSSSRSI